MYEYVVSSMSALLNVLYVNAIDVMLYFYLLYCSLESSSLSS